MVFLKEEPGKVEITGFPQESVSEKAGMKVGDIILAINEQEVTPDTFSELALSLRPGQRAAIVAIDRRTGRTGSVEVVPR